MTRQHSEIDCLLDASARIGVDPLLVQAGTGNTSVKVDGVLWIKASGKWLAHARHDELLVPLDLAAVRTCVREDRDLNGSSRINGSSLRPSIETFMHAVLPHRVVFHVHSVNTIAWAVRVDGPEQVAGRLAGLRWQWIPYVPSGRPLAVEIEKALTAAPESDVFVLANHGLVVCGQSCQEAEDLLKDVDQRLSVQPRAAPEPDFKQLERAANGSWSIPESPSVHALGTDHVSGRIVSQGTLYPCQAIFFGDNPSSFRIVEDAGIVVHKDITKTERAMLGGLVDVAQRLEASAPIAYLARSEVERAMNVEARSYRAQVEACSTPAMKCAQSNGTR